MCFLTAGNICAQTTLRFDDGHGHPYGVNYEKTGTVVKFKDDGTQNSFEINRSYVGGAAWATTFTPGETHTFTVTLNIYSGTEPVVRKLYIAALNCEIPSNVTSLGNNIVAKACIVPPTDNTTNNVLTLEVNQPYKAVCLFKENWTTNWEVVDIASVTRTVSLATPVDIRESEDNTITAKNNATVNLYRTLTAGMWNTICLPFVPSPDQVKEIFGEGAKFAQFSSVSNGVMQFTSVTGSLVAGTPYLVLPTENCSTGDKVVLTGVNIEATEPGEVTHNDDTGYYTFQGIYRPTPFAKKDWDEIRFVGTGNQLLKPGVENPGKPNESNPLKALRAYFTVPVPGASTGAKNYTYAVDSFVPTSIANIQIEGDGDGAIYNIGGQRVEGKSLPKGIYIRDGKKFVVK